VNADEETDEAREEVAGVDWGQSSRSSSSSTSVVCE